MLAHSFRRTPILLTLLAILVLTTSDTPISAQPSSGNYGDQAPSSVSDATFRSSPVMFIENAGQWDDRARFQVWGGTAGTMWLAEDAIWITVVERTSPPARPLRGEGSKAPFSLLNDELQTPPSLAGKGVGGIGPRAANIKLSFADANPHPRIEPFDRLDTKVSYFIGSEPEQWRPGVPVWGGVRYLDLYPGLDLEVTSEGGQWGTPCA